VTWSPDLEVDISFKIVRKKPQAKLKGYQADRIVQIVKVISCEKPSRHREIALQDGLAKVKIEIDFLPFFGLFSKGVTARAEAVTDIIMDQAWLDCVQVNNADGLTCGNVHHDVVYFRITMNRPEKKSSLRLCIFKDMRQSASLFDKLQTVIYFI